MGKHGKNLNTTPYDQYVEPDQKAKDFDTQYEQNRDAGNAKEAAGEYRPEPEGRGSNAY